RTVLNAVLAVFLETKFCRSDNSTVRATDGKVDEYQPEDREERYEPITYLDETLDKYIPGDYEFDMPDKLLKLEKKKKYGKYGIGKRKKTKLPVTFIATNNTIGGNSRSRA